MKMRIFCFLLFLIVGISSEGEFPTDKFRLENYVRPIHYDLLLDLYIPDKYYMGTVDITLVSEQEMPASTRHIELNSKGLYIDSYSVKLMKNEETIKIGAIIEQNDLEKIIFLLNKDLETDTIYKLHMEFTGSFAVNENHGLLLRSFTNESNGTSEYVAANLFPMSARTIFPCFDEPHLKATFNLTLTHPPDMKGLSTMPLLHTNYGINIKGERIIWSVFQQTPRISPSSIGIFVSNMASAQSANAVSIWARNRHEAEQIARLPHFELFHGLMQSLTFIHLQVPLNFVFIPDLHVETFESFGIIFIRSNDLYHKLNVESVSGKIIANIMGDSELLIVETAKQVAAQYVGHMTTPRWWTDIWLRESLSQYYGLHLACKLDKNSSYENLIPAMLRNQVFDERFKTSQIIGENFNSSTQLMQSLSSSRTNRGVSLLFMLSDTFSETIFFQGVSSFLKKFFLDSATTQDLIREWENQLRINNITLPHNLTLVKILQPWLISKEEPILSITRIHEPSYSSLIISEFKSPNSGGPVKWYIPLHYTSARDTDYSSNPAVEHWLGPHNENGKIKYRLTIQNASGVNDWILFNPKGSGLYRVSYDSVSWNLLIDQLKINLTEIPTTGRSQLIADAFSLARDGKGLYSNALELTEYLVNETSFLPWYTAFKAFEELDNRLHHNERLYKSFQIYVGELVQTIYKKLDFERNTRNSTSVKGEYLNILLRSKTMEWACKYDNVDCAENAMSTLKQYLAGNITMIRDEYMDAIFCGGLSQADAHTWDDAYNNLNYTSSAKKSIIMGLGCSKRPHLINRYLDKTLTEDMKTEDAMDIFNGIYKRHYNYERALKFFEVNTVKIQEKYGNETFNNLLIGIARYATTIQHIEQLNRISSRIDASGDLLIVLNQTQKIVQELANWMLINEDDLSNYFNKKYSTIMHGTSTDNYSTAVINGVNVLLLGFMVLCATTLNAYMCLML